MRFLNLILILLMWTEAVFAVSTTNNNKVVGKTLKVASEYVTSMSKIDGSFESGNTGWVASVGTITPTASTEFQGNYKGLWSATGTGTLDLQWTATASNTYEASAIVSVDAADSDHYICSVVNGVETGCTLFDGPDYTPNKQIKVSAVADSVKGASFYLRIKHTGTDAFNLSIDDGKIQPWTPQTVQTVSSYYARASIGTATATNQVTFTGLSTENDFFKVTSSGIQIKQTGISYTIDMSCATTTGSSQFYVTIDGASIAASTMATTTEIGVFNTNGVSSSISTWGIKAQSVALTGCTIGIIGEKVRNNVVQAWQDGTEWTSLNYTQVNALTGNQGLGTFSAGGVEWKRDGGDLLYKGKLTVGTTAASEARLPLPAGLISADTTKIPSVQITGVVARSVTLAGAANVLIEPSKGYIVFGANTSTRASLDKLNGDFFTTGETMSFSVRIPIQGWSSTPTLLALPTSKENTFSGAISGAALIYKKSSDWINSASTGSTGIYTLDFTKLGLTTPPAITVTAESSDIYGSATTITATSATIRMVNAAGTLVNAAFNIILQKQSPDYTAPGVFVGNVQTDWRYDISSYVTASGMTSNSTAATVTKLASGGYEVNIVSNIYGSFPGVSIAVTVSGITFNSLTPIISITNLTTTPGRSYSEGGNSVLRVACVTNDTGVYINTGKLFVMSKPSWAVNTP